MHDLLFWLFAAIIAIGSLFTVTLKNLLHAAIAFMGSLLGIAALFVLMQHEFVALMQVMVYVGGVVIFVVYTILLTTRLGEAFAPPTRHMICGGLLASLLTLIALGAFAVSIEREPTETDIGLHAIGTRLLSSDWDGFLIPFELISLLLLSALIGAATIAQQSKALVDPDDEEGEL